MMDGCPSLSSDAEALTTVDIYIYLNLSREIQGVWRASSNTPSPESPESPDSFPRDVPPLTLKSTEVGISSPPGS